MGLIYRRQDRLELAEKHYRLALEYDPRQDAAHVNLAQLYQLQGKEAESIEQFRQASRRIRTAPTPSPWPIWASTTSTVRKLVRRSAFYLKALQVDPDYAMVHRYVASIFAMPEFSRPRQAIYHLRRTLELDPDQEGADALRELLAQVEEQDPPEEDPAEEDPEEDAVESQEEQLE